ncbi:sulfotransferase [Thiohalorhabdus methylotrophus]|uniref:Sulfotransferase n=1 Tax=Thiohalorhabdus methylotrophus TaxID=3242694 RepID=A0ABV4TTA1_9GAMM
MLPSRPIIVIGMHRSGTSMLAGLLRKAGVYIGRNLGKNEEALYFRTLNRWLLAQAGGSWTHPQPIHELLEDEPSRQLAREYLKASLQGPRSLGYWGATGILPFQPAGKRLWGWKDPRSTFTLPLWLDLFPEARVIHMERHGVDIAESLAVRRARSQKRTQEHFRRRRFLYRFVSKKTDLLDTPRLASRERAFELWEEYLAEGRAQMASLGVQGLSLVYESFLQDPVREFARVAEFCGLEAGEDRIRAITGHLDPERAFAYRSSPELRAFAEARSDRLQAFGYAP